MTTVATVRAVAALNLMVEVVGCPTVCLHCWAQGVPYPAMPLADVRWLLEEAHRFADAEGVPFDAFPMHEVAAHPKAGDVLRLFAAHVGGQQFQPLATTGVPLATRDDWRDVLAAAREVGTRTVWLAFHGVGEVHDAQVSRAGAYRESLRAAERARETGFRVGANVFVTAANLPQLDELAVAMTGAGVEETDWAPASFYPTTRGRRNERLRPTLDQLRPIAPTIAAIPGARLDRAKWEHLEAHTEAAYVEQALAGIESDSSAQSDATSPALVVQPNLDLHAGTAGRYRERLGNLRADGVGPLLRRALAGGWCAGDAVWFDLDPVPPLADLAVAHGDASGQGVHFWLMSPRMLWLDRAQRATQGP